MDWFLYDRDLRHERVNPASDSGLILQQWNFLLTELMDAMALLTYYGYHMFYTKQICYNFPVVLLLSHTYCKFL